MKKHICLICIGSNTDREINIPFAQKHLKQQFPTIVLGSEQDTVALSFFNLAHFTNQVAFFTTTRSIKEVQNILKKIEHLAGRLATDKAKEIVKLDIDLLIYDGQFLKEKDLAREYIVTGIQELNHLIAK